MKALRTAAFVVGAVALTVGTAGALAPVATAGLLGSIGITATAASVATIAGAISGALSLAATVTAPKGALGGATICFTLDEGAASNVHCEPLLPRRPRLPRLGQRLFLARWARRMAPT